MRRSLQPLAVLLVALVLIGVIAVAGAVPPSDDSNPSSRSAGRLGTLALYTWLGRLGLSVSRVSGTFTLDAADVLVEYDPSVDFSPAELDSVTSFLHRGGDLLLVLDSTSVAQAVPLLERLGVQIDTTAAAGTAVPAQPFDPADAVHQVPVGPGFALLEQHPLVPLLRENGDVVAGGAQLGAGRAYVVGDSQPLSNDGLRHDDSASFVLSLLERTGGGRIAFDEFHHGEGGGTDAAAAIFAGPVGVAAALAAILVVVFLAVSGRRIGRAVPAADTTTAPSATTYVTAMADLFARSRRRGMIAGRYADELKRRVGALTGVAAHLDDGSFVAALAAAGDARAAEIHALLSRARRLEAGNPDERALLHLARDIDAAERAWPATAQWRP